MRKNKRSLLLTRGLELFNQFGSAKVTVQEICARSRTSKGTFYKYFSNKAALLAALLADFSAEVSERFSQLCEAGLPFPELVKQVLQLKEEWKVRYTPLFFHDLYQMEAPEIRRLLRRIETDSRENALIMYERGREEGVIDERISREFFFYQLDRLQQTHMDSRVVAWYPDPNQRRRLLFDLFFYGLIKRK